MEFSPAVYEHAAALIGRSPWEVSRNGDLLAAAHAEAYLRYQHRPVVVGIDIYNLEAEAWGATVRQPDGNGIPAIGGTRCSTVSELTRLQLPDPSRDGRLPMVIEAGRSIQTRFPESDVRIPVSGPFSIASNILGFENLLSDVLTSPDETLTALLYLVDGQVTFCRKIREAGLEVSLFESAVAPPLLSPRLFRSLVLPPLTSFLRAAAALFGHPVPCIIGGNTVDILPSLMETGTGYVICPSETDQSAFMKAMEKYPGVTVRVNMDPGVFARGDPGKVRSEIDRVAGLARPRPGACVGTGVLPFETNPDIVLMARDYAASLNEEPRRG